jgi:Na+-driven multidrug efflux pump
LIQMASWTFMIKLMSRFGTAASAGYGIAIRIIIFTVLPSWGLGGAAATLVGQNLGAKQPDRAEASVWRACQFNAVFLALVSIVFIFFPQALMRLFIEDPKVVAVGADCLRIFAYDYVVFAFGMVLVQAFNGAGDSRTPMLVNLFCYWLFQIPLAYYLSTKTELRETGIFWAVMITEAVLTGISVVLFRRGKWKQVQI